MLGSKHVHQNAQRIAPGPDSAEYCTLRCTATFNAVDRAANAPVPCARNTAGAKPKRDAKHHPHRGKLPENGQRQGVVHARVEQRKPKFECSDSDVRVALRKNEVKQQQDWWLVFVDRLENLPDHRLLG